MKLKAKSSTKKVPATDMHAGALGFIPSMITVLAMTLGIHAIKFMLNGQFSKAALCIVFSGLLDALDGRVARYLQVSSKFGGTLDTLADFLNFGILPPFILYMKYFDVVGNYLFWVAVIVYINCMALRLARFSVSGMEEGNFFKGLPSPGAAFLLTFPFCCEYSNLISDPKILGYISIFLLFFSAFLMISHFKTISVSRATIKRHNFPVMFIVFAIALSLLYSYTWYFIIFIQFIYLASVFIKKNH